MVDYLLFIIYKIFKFIVLLLPKFLVKIFLNMLSSVIYFVNKEHKFYAKQNLDFVYGDKISESRKQEIIKNSYKNLIYNLYDFIESQTLDLDELEKKVTVENEHVLVDAIQNNKKIILVSAHYGNWEYVTSYVSLKYKAVTVVGRKMNNKYFNEDMEKGRGRHNSEMLYKANSAKGLMKALRNDKMIGLVTDQHIDPKKGAIIDFLGHKAPHVDSSARLAIKFDAVIIPLFVEMNGFRDYTIKICDPINHKDYEGENQIQNMIQEEANVMSKQILEKPDLWFWQHRRFKEFNKDIYDRSKS